MPGDNDDRGHFVIGGRWVLLAHRWFHPFHGTCHGLPGIFLAVYDDIFRPRDNLQVPPYHWEYSWKEIASWGRDIAPNGDEDIYFVVKDSGERHYIQAVQDNMLESVRAYFRRQCGDPQIHTDGMET